MSPPTMPFITCVFNPQKGDLLGPRHQRGAQQKAGAAPGRLSQVSSPYVVLAAGKDGRAMASAKCGLYRARAWFFSSSHRPWFRSSWPSRPMSLHVSRCPPPALMRLAFQ
jgi:hypothetical protein